MPPGRFEALLGAAIPVLRRDARPDAELLARFLDAHDEAAFEALLVRHTPAVRAACRGWLRCAADIDDAAQATFLVLVRRAHSIRNRAALGRWLYRVAANVARRLRRQQRTVGPLPDAIPGREPAAYDDLPDLLAEEVARLPEKYRLPVQLCYAAGLTTAEAAQRLGWPKGTVLTRLAWARGRLQKCLARRGVAPAALASLAAAPAVNARWLQATVRAARGVLAGEPSAATGVSERTASLTEGVVRTMIGNRLKCIAVAALVAVGLAGFGVGHWASGSDGPKTERRQVAEDGERHEAQPPAAREKESAKAPTAARAKADDARPGTPGRRREAVIRLPAGTFVKEIDVPPYGSGRVTWTYEEERVVGLVEGSVMGGEFEIATEAEYSLSSNGTIYGILTSVRVNHLRLPDGEQFAEMKPYLGLWSAVEPLVTEMTTDLPFSYQFRLQGDRFIISNFRMLLAGPNPLGKLGGLAAGGNEGFALLLPFQALATAVEGTYTTADAEEKSAPGKRPPTRRFRSLNELKKSK
jgi:RNA polymerase sigma factor (sigma-70 family)